MATNDLKERAELIGYLEMAQEKLKLAATAAKKMESYAAVSRPLSMAIELAEDAAAITGKQLSFDGYSEHEEDGEADDHDEGEEDKLGPLPGQAGFAVDTETGEVMAEAEAPENEYVPPYQGEVLIQGRYTPLDEREEAQEQETPKSVRRPRQKEAARASD